MNDLFYLILYRCYTFMRQQNTCIQPIRHQQNICIQSIRHQQKQIDLYSFSIYYTFFPMYMLLSYLIHCASNLFQKASLDRNQRRKHKTLHLFLFEQRRDIICRSCSIDMEPASVSVENTEIFHDSTVTRPDCFS